MMEMADSLRLKLNRWQDDFVFTDIDNVALFNEFGSGKTSAGIIKMQMLLNDYPKNVGVVLRNISDELKTATIPQYFELIFGDRNYVPDSVYYNIVDKHLIFENGSELWFMALDNIKSMRKLKNMVIGALWADQGEELDQEIWTMACGRIRLKNVPLRKFITGNAEGGDHWAKNMYYVEPLEIERDTIDNIKCEWGYWKGLDENYLGIIAKPKVNEPNLPAGYYDSLKKLYPNDWVLKYVYSQWTGKTGMVYPFNDENIVEPDDYFDLNNIPFHWQLFEGQDYGISETNPMVWLWFLMLENGDIHLVNEYYEYEQGIDHCIRYVKEFNTIFDKQQIKSRFIVGCPRTFQREGTSEKKPADLFRNQGIPISEYKIHFDIRQPIVSKLIEENRFKIWRRCENTIRELNRRRWKNIKTADDHATEALERALSKMMTIGSKQRTIDDFISIKEKPLTSRVKEMAF